MTANKFMHIGARALDPTTIINTMPNILNLVNTIDTFRKNAFSYQQSKLVNDSNIKEQYDNVVSILGNRGIGKTSTMLTIIRELRNGTYFDEDRNKNDKIIDVFSPLIAPEDMSENSDILGWIIIVLEKIYEDLKEKDLTYTQEKLFQELDYYFVELKRFYQYRKPESNVVINESYENTSDFARRKIEYERGDFELVPLFQMVFESLIKLLKIRNTYKYSINSDTKEGTPLIFFFFDDVDVATKHSISILRDIMTFLSHPNVVVFISGDYKVFSQSATLNMLAEEKLNYNAINTSYIYGADDVNDCAINLAKSRSEFFLRKVLPPMYRYELKKLSNEDKANISYKIDGKKDYNIIELIDQIFKLPNNKENFLYITTEFSLGEDFFDIYENYLVNKDGLLEIKKDGNSKRYIVYPYLSLFSTSARGFVNVYNYLYNLLGVQKKWDLRDLSDLLDIIINSKSTFIRYKNEISKYLRLNKNIYIDGANDGTNLIIDCEELRLFIQTIPKPITLSELREYESLIILPIFFNELGYRILNNGTEENYKVRYKSVQYKLKELFMNQFMAKINPDLNLLPDTQSFKMILSFYYRITSRMSITALSNILVNQTTNEMKNSVYNIRNDKKYFVQLFRCYLYFNKVIYFEIEGDNKHYYIYQNSKFYDIETLIPRGKRLLYGKKVIWYHLTEEKYRQALVSNENEREIYEKILSIYIYFMFKEECLSWVSNLYLHAKNCMMIFDKNDLNYGLYPFSYYYNTTIFPIVDSLKAILNSDNKYILELEYHLYKLSEIIDIKLLIEPSMKGKIKKIRDNLVEKYQNTIFELDLLDDTMSNNQHPEIDELYLDINKRLRKNMTINNIKIIRNTKNEKMINRYIINKFNEIKKEIIVDNTVFSDFSKYDIAFEINSIFNEYTGLYLDETELINKVELVIMHYSDENFQNLISFIKETLDNIDYQNLSIDMDRINHCMEEITKIILRETRKYRLILNRISDQDRKKYAKILAQIMPIYILIIYLTATSPNVSEYIVRDHKFFYNIYRISEK